MRLFILYYTIKSIPFKYNFRIIPIPAYLSTLFKNLFCVFIQKNGLRAINAAGNVHDAYKAVKNRKNQG